MSKKIISSIILLIVFSTTILAETRIDFDIQRGKHWFHDMKIGFIKKTNSPQMAIWTEDMDGNFLGTLYVSKHTFKWRKNNIKKRNFSLPVWWYKVGSKIDTVAGASQNGVDGLAGATITSDKQLYAFIDSKPKVKVFIEMNNSFDYNDYFTKKGKNNTVKAAVNGQPSIIYSAVIDPTKDTKVIAEIVGYGSVDGNHGDIETKDLSKFTTAKELVNSIEIEIK